MNTDTEIEKPVKKIYITLKEHNFIIKYHDEPDIYHF